MIRSMRESDVEVVAELAQANYDGVMAEHHSAGVLAGFRADITPEFFRGQLSWKQVFVAEQDGEVVATGALADFGTLDEPRLTVSQFYVRADLHRRGIGRALLDHLIRLASDSGAHRLHVPSSRNAVVFYQASGFTVDAVQPDAEVEITSMTRPLQGRPVEQAN